MANVISKEDWAEWCQNPVTDELFVYIADMINTETWKLVEGAGSDSASDARSSGKAMAWGEILQWKPESIAKMSQAPEAPEYVGGFDET